ncbi:hypothetical protein vB_PsyM_KIL3b_0148 [Pseudomonas phage vB_PsyM_KIL3b]|uniref:Uncharacterized protein n=5 Tax=Flaumdravirus TaxID=2560133 RepID=A0A142IF77_9CAUD|nr:hypothetical protein BH774_gp055 [Pseudomonas phage vB_PsyM_KIL1]YP_009616835.1 hypothetical protein FDI83_gp055 [Pseudomonas phage vB_PsyM_KIL4]AMR57715.1 hypothetical protein vB_PsyM_KIL3_0148 [Pseudomonas phage vB_PsyM_KIL3]AMR58051.1 hypothetical protein vB_PsyM_KIL5_0160 [Pseudomonas phage vB_PsyM_KIL5]AMR58213.1 hypothetical protein vB_PsyM_KIL3b_0148 [Pseudomonas phage vB_PsyM_KIL3b]AMR57394.1 hypothetical protein vB_PsyM_KIL1_0147 [Pseudomonas phage vB_PsyM_KIL1]AMR57882.1 hypothet
MFWKVYRKGSGAMVDKIWFTPQTTAEEVYECLEDEYDFCILITPYSED